MIVGKLQVSELESVSFGSLDVVHIKSWVFNGVDAMVESLDGVGIGSVDGASTAVETFDGMVGVETFDGVVEVVAFDGVTEIEAF